jgi:hypothetical protein
MLSVAVQMPMCPIRDHSSSNLSAGLGAEISTNFSDPVAPQAARKCDTSTPTNDSPVAT